MLNVEEWKREIYLSPERHRLQRGAEITMRHDMYSLGVVSLEIAFWASFVDRRSLQLGKLVWQDQTTRKGPEVVKKTYLSLATGSVPRLMDQKYADVVVACLRGLEDELKKGSLTDGNGIVVGMTYLIKINQSSRRFPFERKRKRKRD